MAFSAVAQKPVLELDVNQCDTIDFSVANMAGDRYTWDIYSDPDVNFATIKGDVGPVPYFANDMYEGSMVRVIGLGPGTYFIRVMVWDEVNCTNNLVVYKLNVLEFLPEAELFGDSVCIGEPQRLKIILTGRGPWDVVYTEGTYTKVLSFEGETGEEFIIPIADPLPVGRTKFWVMEVVDDPDGCAVVHTYEMEDRPGTSILIYPKPRTSPIYLKE